MAQSVRNPTRYANTLVAIIPLLVMGVGIALLDRMYPIYINSNTGLGQDPAYQYLFAGVDILQGQSPAHTDHPGTPLQTLIAAIIATTWGGMRIIGLTDLSLFDTVLHWPELYLLVTSCTLLAMTFTALVYFGQRIYQATQSLPTAIACQLAPLLYTGVIPNLVFPTPEALLICISTTLMGVLTPIVLSRAASSLPNRRVTAYWAGSLCGLGLATKLTFLPMLGLLLLFKRFSLILLASLFCGLAWLIGVLPIWPRLAGMFRWFYSLLTHSGIHGSGANELFDFTRVKMALGWLSSQFHLFYGVALCLIVALASTFIRDIVNWLRHDQRAVISTNSLRMIRLTKGMLSDEQLTAMVFCLILIGHTLMVAKHLGPSYMIPALPLPMLVFAWLLHQQNFVSISKTTVKVLATAWLVTIITTAVAATSSSLSAVRITHQKGLESHALIREQLKRFDNPLVIGAFNCNFAECALWFGMALVPKMELRMAPITPNFYYFDIFSKKLHVPGQGELTDQQTRETIVLLTQQARPVLLISPPFPHLNKLRLELIVSTPVQNLYRVLDAIDSLNR